MPSVTNLQNLDLPILGSLTAVGGLLETGQVHLFTNDLTPSKGSVLGDFVESTFNGYASQGVGAAQWSAPYVNANGDAERSTNLQVQFQASGIAVQEMVHGWYLTDDPPTLVMVAERFATPVPMGTAVGQRLGLILRMVLAKNGLDGSALQIV